MASGLGGVVFGLALATEVSAQDVSVGKRVYGMTAACTRCHGWAGNGAPEGPGYPTGANLRGTTLARAQIKEVVQCGRPGTEMPSFARGAWGTINCFGMTAAQVGDQKPAADSAQLGDLQIEALLDYLFAKVVGMRPVTKADCEEYFGVSSPRCAGL